MGIYNILMHSDSVLQAVVTDDNLVIVDNLQKLKDSLKIPVVGVDSIREVNGGYKICVLSSRTLCLLVSYYNSIPQSVKDFINDRSICFVSMDPLCAIFYGEVKLWNLAARVLKKPSLDECRCLKTLAGEVGVQWRQPPKLANELEVDSRCGILFSQEEMEFLVRKAYYIFVTGAKLLGSLEE